MRIEELKDIENRRQKQSKHRNMKNKRRKKNYNREYRIVSGFFVVIFLSLISYVIYFNAVKSEDFINSPYNTRQDTFSDRVIRGNILSADGQILATTAVYEGGIEERIYPYSNIFSHVIGYDSHGKSGLESEANFQLLTSHEFFVDQMKKQMKGSKNKGDTVVSTLRANLQTTAYYALGDRKGAIVAMEPSTGKILAMVSKPDFDPNYLAENWDWLVNDASNSSLLNRATNGLYPPGSTFKIVTVLDYLRNYGDFQGYSYLCQGSVTVLDHTISCYNQTVHGQEDLYHAFASSCNCAFADMGLNLGASSLKKTSENLLFNKKLPLESIRKSTFSLEKNSEKQLIMQTSIGQGDTLVSPMHMAMITCSIANDGILMEPYLIDKVMNANGDVVTEKEVSVYKRLMSEREADMLGGLMKSVVEYGTAYSLYGRGYTVAGKTGSAEFDQYGSSHSWFVGYCNTENPDMVVAIIVENGGTGSEAAVPIAAQLFDAYYYG